MADLRRRMQELRAVATEHLPGDAVDAVEFAHVVCDGCGAVLHVDPAAPLAPGWQMGPPDYCPGCIG